MQLLHRFALALRERRNSPPLGLCLVVYDRHRPLNLHCTGISARVVAGHACKRRPLWPYWQLRYVTAIAGHVSGTQARPRAAHPITLPV